MGEQFQREGTRRVAPGVDRRLAAYVAAAGAAGMAVASPAQADIVAHRTPQTFGVNGDVNIDFNVDGQTDFQIDHDRVVAGGNTFDYLQIDKNDYNGAANPLDFDPITGFQAATFTDGATARNDANNSAYVIDPNVQGSYPAALTASTPIGATSSFDFQESSNFQGSGKWIRAQRLIDEDATQIDQILGGRTPSDVQIPSNGPNFIGLGGQVRYLGLKMELNNTGLTNYGWIGIRIDNEADATGTVTGWAYESTPGTSIAAGDRGVKDGDFNGDGVADGADFLIWQRQRGTSVTANTGADQSGNGVVDAADLAIWKGGFGSSVAVAQTNASAVPEPANLLMAAIGGLFLMGTWVLKRRDARSSP